MDYSSSALLMGVTWLIAAVWAWFRMPDHLAFSSFLICANVWLAASVILKQEPDAIPVVDTPAE